MTDSKPWDPKPPSPFASSAGIFAVASARPATLASGASGAGAAPVVTRIPAPLRPGAIPSILAETDLVCGGGGSLMPAIAAAAYEVASVRRIKRACGTSAGSVAAAAIATGMTQERALAFVKEHLADNRLLDASLWPLDRYGIFAGDALLRALERAFPGTLGETRIPLTVVVSDLWLRRPVALTSEKHPEIPIAYAVRASCGIPVFFKSFVVSKKYFGSRTFVDGGCAMNFAMDMYDDVPERQTVGIRVRSAGNEDPKPVRDLASFASALGELFMWSSDNAHISNKNYCTTIDIVTDFDGLDFSLTPEQTVERWKVGSTFAKAAIH